MDQETTTVLAEKTRLGSVRWLSPRTRKKLRGIARVTYWTVTLQLGRRLAERKAAKAAAKRADWDAVMAERDAAVAERDAAVAERDAAVAERDQLAQRNEQLLHALRPLKSKLESDSAFNEALIKQIESDFNNFHEGNWDIDRFGPEPQGIAVQHSRTLQECYAIVPDFGGIGYLYNVLTDLLSKEILVGLFSYRIIGYRKVRLHRNNEFYWKSRAAVHALTKMEELKIPCHGSSELILTLLDLRPLGYELKFFMTLLGANITFLQKQYELHRGNVNCKAEAGDVVIDAGGCWGDTALYFAHEVGQNGKVVSLEFIPSNLEVMRKNLELNPHLMDRITVVPQPLWSTPDNVLYYIDRGPASHVSAEKIVRDGVVEGMCMTTTIDQMVEKLGLNSVDFIKMDIEGAELPSLNGAELTLRKYRPKLAISLYHRIDDFRLIPRYIDSLDLGYTFYLDHATIHLEETVLFCVPGPGYS